jgi:hypothetical protein
MAEPYSFFKVVNCGGELEAGMKQGLQSIRRFVESLGRISPSRSWPYLYALLNL